MSEKLVEIKDLEISFGEGSKKFVAVKNANFFINKGETFSLVGESGSGKTTIGRAIIGLNVFTIIICSKMKKNVKRKLKILSVKWGFLLSI